MYIKIQMLGLRCSKYPICVPSNPKLMDMFIESATKIRRDTNMGGPKSLTPNRGITGM